MNYKNIIFDLGGVLINWSPKAIVQKQTSDTQMQQRILTDVFGHQDWLDMDGGLLSEEELVGRIACRLQLSEAAVVSLFDNVRQSLTTKQETVDLLYQLQTKYNIFCLSNIHTNNFNYLRDRNDFFGLFQDAIVSSEIKMLKPSPEIYHYALNRFAIVADQTIFIDDSKANIESAQKLGIKSILFENVGQCRNDLEVLGIL